MTKPTSTPTMEDLEYRLHRGSEFLFDMEQRGEIGREYRRWLRRWTKLLEEYEMRHEARPDTAAA